MQVVALPTGRASLWLGALLGLACVAEAAQESISYFASLSYGLNYTAPSGATPNFVYFIMVIFAMMVFGSPILAWIYRVFLTKLVKEIVVRGKQLSAKIR